MVLIESTSSWCMFGLQMLGNSSDEGEEGLKWIDAEINF